MRVMRLSWVPTQTKARFPNHPFQPSDFRRQHTAARRSQTIVAAARIVSGSGRIRLFHQSLRHQLLEIVVKRAGADLVPAFGLPRNLLHNAVAVAILRSQREQNVQRRW